MKQNNVFNFLPFEAKVGIMAFLLTLLTFNAKQESSSRKQNQKIKEKVSAFNSVAANKVTCAYFVENLKAAQNNQPINVNNLLLGDKKTASDTSLINIDTQESDLNATVVKIVTGKRMVKYIYSDGRIEVRQGGTLPWRNKNPGALRGSSNSVGRANGFAVFASEEEGLQSLRALLNGKNYRNLTLGKAMFKYAPPHENDTKRYQANIRRMTGIDLNVRLRDLTEEEMERVIKTIRQLEGWVPGQLTYVEPQQMIQNQIVDTFQKTK
jgi:hypothetical protein